MFEDLADLRSVRPSFPRFCYRVGQLLQVQKLALVETKADYFRKTKLLERSRHMGP